MSATDAPPWEIDWQDIARSLGARLELAERLTKEAQSMPPVGLRDYFAGQALPALLSAMPPGCDPPVVAARGSYAIADAMLSERGKPSGDRRIALALLLADVMVERERVSARATDEEPCTEELEAAEQAVTARFADVLQAWSAP